MNKPLIMYVEVLKDLKKQDLKVMLTIHHFTLPLWLSKQGGWETSKSVRLFERYVEKIVPEIKDYIDFWITINEPGYSLMKALSLLNSHLKKRVVGALLKCSGILPQAHRKAYKAIHKLVPKSKVGLTKT